MTSKRGPVLSCFASLMRVSYSWPVPRGREDRALRTFLITTVRKGFKQHKNEKDPAKIKQLLAYATEQLRSLEQIRKSVFATQFPFTDEMKIPGVVKRAAPILAGKSLH